MSHERGEGAPGSLFKDRSPPEEFVTPKWIDARAIHKMRKELKYGQRTQRSEDNNG